MFFSLGRRIVKDFGFLSDYGYVPDKKNPDTDAAFRKKDATYDLIVIGKSYYDKHIVVAINKHDGGFIDLLENVTFNTNSYKDQVPYAQKVLREWLDKNN